jgi:hypothetical protein
VALGLVPPLVESGADGWRLFVLPVQECCLSGLLAVKGLRVLHLDRNTFYGGECASLNVTVGAALRACSRATARLTRGPALQNLYRKFVKDEEPPEEFTSLLGPNRYYNVDLIPKFIMAKGASACRVADDDALAPWSWSPCPRVCVPTTVRVSCVRACRQPGEDSRADEGDALPEPQARRRQLCVQVRRQLRTDVRVCALAWLCCVPPDCVACVVSAAAALTRCLPRRWRRWRRRSWASSRSASSATA